MSWERGDRVRLVHTSDGWTTLRPGDLGTVDMVTEALGHPQVWVHWDNGSKLAMLPGEGDVIEHA